MKRYRSLAAAALAAFVTAAQQQPGRGQPFQPKPEDIQQIQSKTAEIEDMVKGLKAKQADSDLLADVEVYGHAGRMLLEFPDQITNQNVINHALAVLDT